MALKDVLAKFRSISRPSLLGGSNSAYSSLVKKTQAAEDAIIDNQYESGDLSPEYYLNKLQERIARGTMTPLQKVNLTQKMQDVQVAVNDADVARRYANKEITTEQVLGYEKSKLAGMTEPGSAAYIKQQQKVQGLVDKAEKEARTNFRISENLRISRLPEDTSANLWEKAQLYQTLSDQARLDGDIQQADTLLASANTYTNSAKKADVNDMITGARLSVSQTPTQGLGVPSASGNISSLGGSANSSGATAGGGLPGSTSGTTPLAVNTTNYETPAITNLRKSLDRQAKTNDRLYGQLQDNQTMIQRYQEAVNAATGDQKTSLQISLNNLIDAGKGIQNQIDINSQNVQDTYTKLQEAQQAAAFASEKKDISENERNAQKEEDNLNKDFRDGKITKEDYVVKALEISQKKQGLYDYASQVHSAYENDAGVEKYGSLLNDVTESINTQIGIANNIDDYEPIANDSNGKITDIFGNKLGAGAIALQDVSGLKNSKMFDANYFFKNGGYHKIQFPVDKVDAQGNLDPKYVTEGLAKFRDTSFVNIFNPDTGKREQVKVGFINDNFHTNPDGSIGTVKPLALDVVEKLKTVGAIKEDASGIRTLNPAKQKSFFEIYKTPKEIIGAGLNWVADAFSSKNVPTGAKMPNPREVIQQNNQRLNGQTGVRQSIPGIVDNVKNFVNKSISGMNPFNPPSTKASELIPEGVSGSVGDIIDKVAEQFKPGDIEFKKVLHAIALAESGGNPNAVGDQGQSIGLFQNRMKLGRGGNYTAEQLKDPQFNTELAAKELVKYYDQAIAKGLKGRDTVEYVSKYGQRPAPGNEKQAGSKYGNFVSNVIGGIKSNINTGKAINNYGKMSSSVKAQDYTDPSVYSDSKKNANVALALGLKPGQYRPGLQQDQAAIDRGFRGDTTTQQLLRSEGLKPSWETKSVSAPIASSQPIASSSGQLRSSQPSSNIGQSISNGISSISNGISNTYNKVSSGVKNVVSKISSSPIFQPKLISPIPEPPKPQNIIQKAASSVSNFVSSAVNKLKGLFK